MAYLLEIVIVENKVLIVQYLTFEPRLLSSSFVFKYFVLKASLYLYIIVPAFAKFG